MLKKVLGGVVAAAAVTSAQAAPIIGDVSVQGAGINNIALYNGPGYGSLVTNANTTSTLDFGGNTNGGGGQLAVSGCSSGGGSNIATAIGGTICTTGSPNGTIADLVNIPNAVGPAFSLANWITIGGLTVDLTALTLIDRTVTTALTLKGNGLLKAGGFDNTVGTWTLTANNSNTTFSWSGSVGATRVPEPGSLALIGLALAGFGFARRRS